MKNSIRLQRLQEGLVASGFIAVPVFLMNASQPLMLITLFLMFIFGSLINNSVALILGLFITLASACVAALLFGQFDPTYLLAGETLLVLLLIGYIAVTLFLKSIFRETLKINLLWALTPFVIIFMKLTLNSRKWTGETAFGVLVNNGEDNAAWLIALSKSVVKGTTVLSASSAASGGPATGVIISTSRQLFSIVDTNSFIANADNALVLLRMYALVAVLTAIVWLLTAFSMLRMLNPIARTGFALVSATIGFAFVMGLAAVGHFSAVIAVFFLSIAVCVSEQLPNNSQRQRFVSGSLVFLSLVAAGQAWFPLTAVALVYAALVSRPFLTRLVPKNFDQKAIIKFSFTTVAVVIICYTAYVKIFPSFLSNAFNLDYVIYNLTLAGGYAVVSPWLVLLGFSLCLWWGFQKSETNEVSQGALVVALLMPIIVLFTWSYFLAPYTPQYGAWKYLYIGAAVAVPWSIIICGRVLSEKISLKVITYVPLLILLGLGLFAPPFQHTNWISKANGSGYEWTKPVVNELRMNPERPVVCLNTFQNDEGTNYAGYLCSRMALGLGGFDTYEVRVWAAANICQIGAEQARLAWPIPFQRNLTVLLFDPARTSSYASCQAQSLENKNGWLSSVDWNVVRKIGPDGKILQTPATQSEVK
jgi:hypothetical protein